LSRIGEKMSFKVMIAIAVCREFSWAEPNWEAFGSSEEEGK